MGARRIFSRGGQIRVWERKSPSGIQGWRPGGGLRAKPPEADDVMQIVDAGSFNTDVSSRLLDVRVRSRNHITQPHHHDLLFGE